MEPRRLSQEQQDECASSTNLLWFRPETMASARRTCGRLPSEILQGIEHCAELARLFAPPINHRKATISQPRRLIPPRWYPGESRAPCFGLGSSFVSSPAYRSPADQDSSVSKAAVAWSAIYWLVPNHAMLHGSSTVLQP